MTSTPTGSLRSARCMRAHAIGVLTSERLFEIVGDEFLVAKPAAEARETDRVVQFEREASPFRQEAVREPRLDGLNRRRSQTVAGQLLVDELQRVVDQVVHVEDEGLRVNAVGRPSVGTETAGILWKLKGRPVLLSNDTRCVRHTDPFLTATADRLRLAAQAAEQPERGAEPLLQNLTARGFAQCPSPPTQSWKDKRPKSRTLAAFHATLIVDRDLRSCSEPGRGHFSRVEVGHLWRAPRNQY